MSATRIALAAALLAVPAGGALAFPIPFSADPCPSGFDCYGFKAGPVVAVSPDAPPELQAFRPGEDVYGRFDTQLPAADLDPAPDIGRFEFPDGGFQLGGLESGAVADLATGLRIDVEPATLTLRSLSPPSPDAPFALDRVEFAFAFEAFPEPDDLLRSLEGPPEVIGEDGWPLFETLSEHETRVVHFAGLAPETGLTFAAPSPRATPEVPAPPALALLLVPAAALLALRRRS